MDKGVHIVGAGISGLGSAHFLKKNGFSPIVYESESQPGGRAGYEKLNDGFFETGGKNFSESWTHFMEIANDLKINELDTQHHAFNIIMQGKLKTFRKKMGLTEVVNMMKDVGVIGSLQFKRMISYKLKHKDQLNFDEGKLIEIEKAYDHAPITEHFHKKLCKGPLRMFSIIMGGAEPEETYYSNLLHLLPFGVGSLRTFSNSIGNFFEVLAANHDVEFNTPVRKIVIEDNKVSGLMVERQGKQEFVAARHALITLPLHQIPNLIDLPEQVKQAIESVRYFPVALINAEYEADIFNEQCQSIMFDDSYHLGHCSANRSYKLNSVRFTIAGKKGREALQLSDEKLIDLAETEFSSVLPINSARVRYHVKRHMGGLCAYGAHHSKAKKVICDYVNSIQGLEIAGDYLEGHNMGACLSSAKKAVSNFVQA
ncbi:NAD(P)-binding protein [Pseudoalteromonas sp. JBTF-M23]|uniref:NAD(P)-binding protein n=1 Tax=Pseudoalteromonas caenipelagi TaxID=2726988 RepID=A0A849VHC6_9GAMM|nr:FAD-dependent oxidoreductase [Pseudoalteromonas caenipelagi]NOU51264.1 NAD(P)-binding protein [Pseudoalteromonas caenipelagi]